MAAYSKNLEELMTAREPEKPKDKRFKLKTIAVIVDVLQVGVFQGSAVVNFDENSMLLDAYPSNISQETWDLNKSDIVRFARQCCAQAGYKEEEKHPDLSSGELLEIARLCRRVTNPGKRWNALGIYQAIRTLVEKYGFTDDHIRALAAD